ncbi:hypothetical protein C8A01DRAFT_14203 [Parachaetomium inaequale]|uniref:Uncharacterized protein n=1 Tax=Parachaetomium inaequale TaxID=2588326 RepID=A0AAN6PLC3_9PEZI|nr:hypothetical protein C8A01DRAFT_14203 [Parachaetomium inaequale]
MFPEPQSRRPSIASARSTSTHRSHSRRQAEMAEDIYLENPEILRFNDRADSSNREPWPLETVTKIGLLLPQITEPPRLGMLERVDSMKMLQMHVENEARVWPLWQRLLGCYDIAMRGRRAALLALADAYNKAYEEEELEMEFNERMRVLTEENEGLIRTTEVLEAQGGQQQQQIAKLEDKNRILVRDGSALQTRYDKIITAREKELEDLEGVIADWEASTHVPTTRSAAPRDKGDHETRFRSIRGALEEARVATAISNARNTLLQDKCNALEKAVEEIVQQPRSQEMGPSVVSELESRSTQLELHNQVLKNELEAERARSAERDKECADLIARLTSQSEVQPQQQQAVDDTLKKEADLYRDKCVALERTVDELQQKIADQAVEAAHDKQEYKTNMDELGNSIKDLHTTVTDAIGGLDNAPASGSSSGNVQVPLLPEEVIRDIEAAQLQTIQSSQAVMDEIRATINGLVEQVTAEMADAKAAHLEGAQQILEELRKLTVSADSWIQDHQTLEENQGLIHDELDALRKLAQSNQHTFQEIDQQVQRQSSQVEAAKTVSQQSTHSEPRPGLLFFSRSKGLSFDASNNEITYLEAVANLISRMKIPPQGTGLDAATRSWANELSLLQQGLSAVEPDTPAEDLMAEFARDLESFMEQGVENDPTIFYVALEDYDRLFDGLLKLQSYVPQPPAAEQELLEKIDEKIERAEEVRETHSRLMKEYQAHQAQHPPNVLNSSQSAEILRLVCDFFETTGGKWNWSTPADQETLASVEELYLQIQKALAHPSLIERRRELLAGIARQETQLAELQEDIPKVKAQADDMVRRLAAFDRLQLKGRGGRTPDDQALDKAFRAGLKRHETRLRREQHYNQARHDRLEAKRVDVKDFLNQETVLDRHRAQRLLAETLLKLQSSGRPERLIISAGTPDPAHDDGTAVVPSCHGHHGHGLLGSNPVSTSLCHILTAFAWLVFLLLVQPHNLLTTLAFLQSALLALPNYLYRLAAHTASRARHRLLRLRRVRPAQAAAWTRELLSSSARQLQLRQQRPKLALPPAPDASTLVSAAVFLFLLYALLSYVAVVVERRIWVGDNDWRYAYLLDITSGRPLPYPGWLPIRVDYRLVTHRVWVWFAEGVHGFFEWRRAVDLGGVRGVGKGVSWWVGWLVEVVRGVGWWVGW